MASARRRQGPHRRPGRPRLHVSPGAKASPQRHRRRSKWLTLATAQSSAEHDAYALWREYVARQMSQGDVAEGERLARAWQASMIGEAVVGRMTIAIATNANTDGWPDNE